MATKTTSTKNLATTPAASKKQAPLATPAASDITPVDLSVVIDELNLILSLSEQSPEDPLLRTLVTHAKEDFLQAIKGFPGGEGLPDQK